MVEQLLEEMEEVLWFLTWELDCLCYGLRSSCNSHRGDVVKIRLLRQLLVASRWMLRNLYALDFL